MVTLICLRCGKFFQHKGGFKKHLLKPEICPPLVSKKSRIEILEYYHFNTNENSPKFDGTGNLIVDKIIEKYKVNIPKPGVI